MGGTYVSGLLLTVVFADLQLFLYCNELNITENEVYLLLHLSVIDSCGHTFKHNINFRHHSFFKEYMG